MDTIPRATKDACPPFRRALGLTPIFSLKYYSKGKLPDLADVTL